MHSWDPEEARVSKDGRACFVFGDTKLGNSGSDDERVALRANLARASRTSPSQANGPGESGISHHPNCLRTLCCLSPVCALASQRAPLPLLAHPPTYHPNAVVLPPPSIAFRTIITPGSYSPHHHPLQSAPDRAAYFANPHASRMPNSTQKIVHVD